MSAEVKNITCAVFFNLALRGKDMDELHEAIRCGEVEPYIEIGYRVTAKTLREHFNKTDEC